MKPLLIVLTLLIFSGLGAIAAMNFTGQATPPELLTSYRYPQQRPLSPFELTDQNGKAFTNVQLKDKWNLFFVGYTSCPDVCPTTLGKLAAAYRQLEGVVDLQVVFLSVDPARDTQKKLKDYIDFFNPNFVAVTATHSQLQPLTRELGFVYTMVGDGDNYQVDHSASMVLISPDGTRVATVKPTSLDPGKLPQIRNKNLIHDVIALATHYGE
ncbi:SCO family protein [Shewanella insulae]|uniref:SCO family protein n=1 Tax=Shewanella insulae TaxID=2681496 RepID=UPI001EFDE87E|nr:SCO family protein [Shewanella insulae]MCG9712846.1 SCO family protein [Shewanella insulae]MCG9739397.1 SCO family protein [Shewanella insulae]